MFHSFAFFCELDDEVKNEVATTLHSEFQS